jgi:hypothetical protein
MPKNSSNYKLPNPPFGSSKYKINNAKPNAQIINIQNESKMQRLARKREKEMEMERKYWLSIAPTGAVETPQILRQDSILRAKAKKC